MYLSVLYLLDKVMLWIEGCYSESIKLFCYFHNQHMQMICLSECSICGCCPEEDCI